MGYGGQVVRSAKVKGVVLETDIVVVSEDLVVDSEDVVSEDVVVFSEDVVVVIISAVRGISLVVCGSRVVKIGGVNGMVVSGGEVSGGFVAVITGSVAVIDSTVVVINSVSFEGCVVVKNDGSRVVSSIVLVSVGRFSVVVIIGGGNVTIMIGGSDSFDSVVLASRVVVSIGSVKGIVEFGISKVVSVTGCVEVISMGSVVVKFELDSVEDGIVSVVVKGSSDTGSAVVKGSSEAGSVVVSSTNSVVVITGGPKVKVEGGSVGAAGVSGNCPVVVIGSVIKSVVGKGISSVDGCVVS